MMEAGRGMVMCILALSLVRPRTDLRRHNELWCSLSSIADSQLLRVG